uniref:Chaperone DnaJ C-terminal domain-containing protein n=1 Tax=Panagrolaimus sp. PS1159 TaxID=55785 RepID=A0AC35GIC9_9BILA
MSYSYTHITSNSNNGGGVYFRTFTHRAENNCTETSSCSSSSSRQKVYAKRQLQDPTIQYDLKISLEDIYKGCVKNMKITKNIFSRDGTSRSEVKMLAINVKPGFKMLAINVKPGCKEGVKFIFPKEGDQHPGHIPADIAFVIKDKPHSHFQRDGVNIRYNQQITLKEALCGTTFMVPTLDGTTQTININSVIKPNTTQRIAELGLPNPQMDNKRGDMIIKFDVQFPHSLSVESKELLEKSYHYF